MPRETERKVYFYHAQVGFREDGSAISYDPNPALDHIETLSFDDGERYHGSGEEVTSCWIDSTNGQGRIRLGKVRRADLPSVEEHGNLSTLDLSDDEGIVEQAHMVFFPDGIVGMLFNFYGPRMARLRAYLKRKHPETPDTLSIDPLLRQDVVQQLNRFGHIRVLRLKILEPFLARLEDANQSLHRAFETIADLSDAEQYELVLRPKPYERSWIDRGGLLDSVRDLAGLVEGDPDAREEVTGFKVKGFDTENESLDEIDVLRDHLVKAKTVVRLGDRSRSIEANSAYEAINEAYEELREDLEAAAAAIEGEPQD